MNVVFLSPSLSRNAGGIFEIERNLARALQRTTSTQPTVMGLKDEHVETDRSKWAPLSPTTFDVVGPRAFGYAPNLLNALHETNADLVHLHALWMYTSLVTLRWSQDAGRPHVVTINGMLDDWALSNGRWKKRIAEWLYERKNLETAACIQVNTEKEHTALRNFGISAPACVIPNGVSLPDLSSVSLPPWYGDISEDQRVLLFLGRIHPKKGLREMVDGWEKWSRSDSSSARWTLAIVGWDDGGHEDALRRHIHDAGLETSIRILGPCFGEEKKAAFAHANAFVLPSHSEGLPMAVLEAWSYRLPVLKTPACNLSGGFDAGAAIKIEPESSSIAQGLNQIASLTAEERAEMGHRGRALVEDRFTWESVAQKMHHVYQWIDDRRAQPHCVYLSS